MLRQLHAIPGLIFGLVFMMLALSGSILALDPALERAGAPASPAISVADLADRVTARLGPVERIERRANGAVVVSYEVPDGFVSEQVDPATGARLALDAASPFMTWMRNLHRSFLLDDPGRATAGVSAGIGAVMAVSGFLLLLAAMGGWRRLARPVRSTGASRWHIRTGRLAVITLAISSLTGAYMSLASFEWIPGGEPGDPAFPFDIAAADPAPVASLAALQAVPLRDLRLLTFPAPDSPDDVFGLQTADGSGYVNQSTGDMITWLPATGTRRVWEFAYMLHTGQGLWWFGLLLGLGAFAVPVLSLTGALVWLKRRRARPRLAHNARAGEAELVVLVGSEGGSTWGFGVALARALQAAGKRVHLAAMNDMAPAYPHARALIALTATWGDGAAPASARGFAERLRRFKGKPVPVAVLGFGERSFAQFCGFAEATATAFDKDGWPELLPLERIDRQSSPDFAAWGQRLGTALGLELALQHLPQRPATQPLQLIARQDFGADVQAPAAILRFGPVVRPGWRRMIGARLPRFAAGDLVGVVPPGSDQPRYYSVASSRRDGYLEIAVRKQPGGLCSEHLHSLTPGARIETFVRANPGFRPARGRAPVVLVAAGCGVGPMAGFLRANRPGREMELYFGTRHPGSDFLYRDELTRWQRERRLSRLVTAFSRVPERAYVQDRLRADAAHLRRQIGRGGQVLVCGASRMAHEVAAEIGAAIAPLGLTVARLKAEGRYVEDVY
jgi:sulfite reductase (NADPH) flavoprotein alpha-component